MDCPIRGLIVKCQPDRDLYVEWSEVCDDVSFVGTRQEFEGFGVPAHRLDRADKSGSSGLGHREGTYGWKDAGFLLRSSAPSHEMEFRWLPRQNLTAYAELLLGPLTDRQEIEQAVLDLTEALAD